MMGSASRQRLDDLEAIEMAGDNMTGDHSVVKSFGF